MFIQKYIPVSVFCKDQVVITSVLALLNGREPAQPSRNVTFRPLSLIDRRFERFDLMGGHTGTGSIPGWGMGCLGSLTSRT